MARVDRLQGLRRCFKQDEVMEHAINRIVPLQKKRGLCHGSWNHLHTKQEVVFLLHRLYRFIFRVLLFRVVKYHRTVSENAQK